MLGFNHTLAGSIIAILVPAPLVPFVALGSHFILDTTPHFGETETIYPYTKSFIGVIVLDGFLCFVALSIAIWLFPDEWPVICIGAFFGILPDFLWPLWHHGPKWLDKFLDWAQWIQWGERPYGWMFDVLYAFLFSFTLFAIAGKV